MNDTVIKERERMNKLYDEDKAQFYVEKAHSTLHPRKGYVGVSSTREPETLEQWKAVARYIADDLEMTFSRLEATQQLYRDSVEIINALKELGELYSIPAAYMEKTIELKKCSVVY